MNASHRTSEIIVAFFFLSIALICLLFSHLQPGHDASAQILPRLYSWLIIGCCIALLTKVFKNKLKQVATQAIRKQAWQLLALFVFYIALLRWCDYYSSTFLFLVTAVGLLERRFIMSRWLVAAAWVGISYFFFYQTLRIALPLGWWAR